MGRPLAGTMMVLREIVKAAGGERGQIKAAAGEGPCRVLGSDVWVD